jgi:hypothetical protein
MLTLPAFQGQLLRMKPPFLARLCHDSSSCLIGACRRAVRTRWCHARESSSEHTSESGPWVPMTRRAASTGALRSLFLLYAVDRASRAIRRSACSLAFLPPICQAVVATSTVTLESLSGMGETPRLSGEAFRPKGRQPGRSTFERRLDYGYHRCCVVDGCA